MAKLLKRLSMIFLLVICAFSLFACGEDPHTHEFVNGECECGEKDPNYVPEEVLEDVITPEYLTLDDYKAYVKHNLESAYKSIKLTDETIKANVKAQYEAGLAAIDAAENYSQVKKASADYKDKMAEAIPFADGVYSFTQLSTEEKTEILGLLEAYAVRNGITGISLFEDGGYSMYNPRVTLGTETYIPGYGFGTLAEGSINADLETENNAAWKRYYHTINAADPGTANYLNDQGSEVSDFYGYFGAGYYTTHMSATKDSYVWVPELASTFPLAVNVANDNVNGEYKELDWNVTDTTWKFEIKVGSELKYNTNSTLRAAYNGRPVEAEDYLTAYKLLLTKANGYFRGSEMANGTGVKIVGIKEYYEGSAEGYNDELFQKLGVKVTEENGKTYFTITYNQPVTRFYAMYYSTSSLLMPIPQDFIDEVGVKNYLGFNEDKTQTPVDNSLSLGSYTLEKWDSEQQVVYKKNPYYVYADSKYAIEGVHINILKAAASDPEAGIKEFLAGKTDATGIPQTRLEEFKNDPRTKKSTGSSNFKLNVNATDAKTWDVLFGENGKVTQTPAEGKWVVEPALSNPNFVKALSLSINRIEFADKRGSIASVDYLSSNYMSDPVNGISYANTQAHKDAVAGLLENTDGCGYNLELAREYFKVALSELEAAGVYTPGTAENPKVIELEIAWMYPQHEENYHNEIKQYFETAFNDASVSGGKYKLDVKFWVGNIWSDVYYGKLMLGQYDLGFGSISGNTLNPLDFVSVLSSDQEISGSFTLNWGTDTNNPNADILVYNNMRWSYDALWTAANSTAIVAEGANSAFLANKEVKTEENEDGSIDVEVKLETSLPELSEIEVEDVVVCWYEDVYANDENWDLYQETVLEAADYTAEYKDGVLTVKFTCSAELVAKYYGQVGFDVYCTETVDGNATPGVCESLSAEFPAKAE